VRKKTSSPVHGLPRSSATPARCGSLALVAASVAGVSAARASDMSTVDTNLTDYLISQTPSTSTVQGYISSLQSNGSWTDIDYSSTAQTGWDPLTHLDRLLSMAEAYDDSASSLYHSASLETDISNAYNYWISADPTSTNWYDNDIAVPDAMGSIMVLVGSNLTSTQLSEGNNLLQNARNTLSNPNYAVGSNLVLLSEAGIDQGLVFNNSSYVSGGFSQIYSTVAVVAPQSGDGIQTDGTYNFHGSQLYEGDYGITAVTQPLQYASYAVGTSYALPTAQVQIIDNALIDGAQWFIYGQALDFTASGRDLSLQSFYNAGTGYISAIQYALSLGTYDQTALEAFLQRQQAAQSSGVANPAYGLTGNRDFFDSDIMVQQRPNYYESARVTSTRTDEPESINGENLEGLYLADGVNQIMVTGNEYANIEPVWNWRRLPGTTVEQNTSSLQPGYDQLGATSYAGGVSDNTYGAEALQYNRFNIAANKSWFFFNNEEVALGSAINTPNATSQVDTTLNQCLLTSTVTYQTTGSGSPQTLTTGSVTPTGLEWVYQGGVGYLFLTPVNNATILAQSQSGNWAEINSEYSNATVTDNVFTLYLDHGTNVSNGSYSYIVVPDTTAAAMATYAASVPVQILSNTANVQAVYQSSLDIAQAAFYNPASVNLTAGSMTVNNDSMVMLERSTDTFSLWAGSPQNLQMSLNVQLAGVPFSKSAASWLDAFGNSTTTFNLPGGNYAGQSVGLTITTNGASSPTVSLACSNPNATVSSNVTAPITLPGNTTFQCDSYTTLNFSGSIIGTASLTAAGSGTINLNTTNTYTGATYVNGGTLGANSPGAFGITPGTTGTASVNVASGAELSLGLGGGSLINYTGQINITGSGINGGGALVFASQSALDQVSTGTYATVNITGGSTIAVDSGSLSAYNSIGPITGSGGLSLISSGTGVLAFNTVSTTAPANSFTGGTTVGSGVTLILHNTGGAAPLAIPGNLTINSGADVGCAFSNQISSTSLVTDNGTFDLNIRGSATGFSASTLSNTIGSLAGGGIVTTSGAPASGSESATLTLAANDSSTETFTGNITQLSGNPVSIIKSGNFTQILSASNSYTGGTTINAGTLVAANSAGSATGSGTVTINGGTLASSTTGDITGNVIGGTGAYIIAPGGIGSIGDLTLGGLTTNSNATLDFDLGPGPASGHIVTNGDLLTLGSGTIIIAPDTNLAFDAAPIAGDDYRLIGGTITGITLSDFTLPTAPPGLQYGLSKTVDPGYIDVTVTAVPEPGALCAIGLSVATLLPRRRRC
jgi:chondroitin AC lyase